MAHSVTVLVGPARSGKTHLLVGQFREALHAAAGTPGRTLWLAPTARAAANVREMVLSQGPPAALDPGIMTFDVLAARVLRQLANPPRVLAPVAERLLLRRVIRAALAAKKLSFLADAARRGTFVGLLGQHFHELKRRGIGPAEFAKATHESLDRRQHRELSLLYTSYQRLLAQHNLADGEGRHWAVRDALAADATLYGGLDLVVADGFADFTHTQLQILARLAERAGRLRISLPDDQDPAAARRELFAKSTATLAELRQLFPKLSVATVAPRETDWPALDHLAAHLFQHRRDVPPPSPAVIESLDRLTIVEAAGPQDEITQIARRIKAQLVAQRQAGERPRPGDFAVVFRTLQQAAPRVREVFTEFGIPFSIEAGVPLAAAGVVRLLLDLLRLETDDWPYRNVVRVVTNNLLTFAEPAARAAAERLIRDLQIAVGRATLVERIDTLAATVAAGVSAARDRQARAAAAARPLVKRLSTALATLPREATPLEWIAAFDRLGDELGIEALQRPVAGTDDFAAWQEVRQHFTAIEQLASWLDEPLPRLTRDEALELLADLAENEATPRPSDDTGRVRVLSAITARNIEAREIFLAGMSEQAFPSPERTGTIYSTADYRFFANAADQTRAEAALPAVKRSQEEMLLFYEVLTRARARLTISYPALDDKAQALSPSPYVTEIKRAVAPEQVPTIEATAPAPLPGSESPLGPADWRIRAVHEALDHEAPDLSLLAGLFQAESQRTPEAAAASSLEAALRIVAARSQRDRFGPAEGLLESAAVRAKLATRFGESHLWSPSQWERYAVCPYRFLLSDILRLEPLGELVLETDHARRGTLVHRALASLHRQLATLLGSDPRLSRHDREKFRAVFANLVETLLRATPQPQGIEAALLELDRLQIDKWAPRYHAEHEKYDAAWAELDEPLVPTYLEWRFGPPRHEESDYEDPRSTSAPFVLEIPTNPDAPAGDSPQETIQVTGRIDRIDVGRHQGGAVYSIVDYKSGKRPTLGREKMTSGERLQPVLYVMAAQAMLFDEQATPLYAGYWSLADGVSMQRGSTLQPSDDKQSTNEAWDTLRSEVLAQISRFVHDIRGGNFPVVSRDEHCTSHCEFATVCRIAQVRSLGKQWFAELPDN